MKMQGGIPVEKIGHDQGGHDHDSLRDCDTRRSDLIRSPLQSFCLGCQGWLTLQARGLSAIIGSRFKSRALKIG